MPGGRRDPTSYDEILRRTVPDPDLGFRPSLEEEQLSRHRFGESTEHRPRPLTAAERRTLDRVKSALEADPALDLTYVELWIDGRELILIGSVPGPSTSARIVDIACAVEGVERVDNELVIRRGAQ